MTDERDNQNEPRNGDIELFHSVLVAAQGALKSITYINGGAAVVIMQCAGSGKLGIPGWSLAWALGLFAFGVLLCAVANGCFYLAQSEYQRRFYQDDPRTNWNVGTKVAISAFVLSCLGFVAGCFITAYGIANPS